MTQSLIYLHGFQNHFETEAEHNALTPSRNSPQKVPYGLYAEQISGSAFTAPRAQNYFSWLYRIQPSVTHGEFTRYKQDKFTPPANAGYTPPTQMRWDPFPYPTTAVDFIDSILTFAGNSSASIHLYAATTNMHDRFFYNADGELLIVAQEGRLYCKTEMGHLSIEPGEIMVIPRGIKFSVELPDGKARGYLLENFGSPLCLPELGVIGANGLANPRDFKTPTARYECQSGQITLLAKFQGQLWSAPMDHSPLDVVAWHGNYAPYKYDLRLFNTMNTVSFDHPDPSIFTVLTSPSAIPGTASVDFVIFPPRWMVANDTFRPPYFHRNVMSEYMGLIYGQYDAKEEGFLPGGATLHNCMSAHGPDLQAFSKGTHAELKPEYYNNTMAFMFEAREVWSLTEAAYQAPERQKHYKKCWEGLSAHFERASHGT